MTRPRLHLYGRGYCHLCDEMQQAVESLRAEFDFELVTFDVDADPVLEARYDVLVPVLADAEGTELCHYVLDAAAVRQYLQGFG